MLRANAVRKGTSSAAPPPRRLPLASPLLLRLLLSAICDRLFLTFCLLSPSPNTSIPAGLQQPGEGQVAAATAEAAAEAEEEESGPRVNAATGEVGGPKGPEPTRYQDWEVRGRVSDF
jgi:hypothetical protein